MKDETQATYPLAKQGVFGTIQGECRLLGVPMVFVRLAGCPVNCSSAGTVSCDTDYAFAERASVEEIARRVVGAATPATKWAWLTGGEPTIHDLAPLVTRLRRLGFRVAVATAGISLVIRGQPNDATEPRREYCDFVSVSPHRIDASWVQRVGDQINLVFGLNDLTPEECEPARGEMERGFTWCYVTPCDGKPETLAHCLEWVNRHKGWQLNVQAHKTAWSLP